MNNGLLEVEILGSMSEVCRAQDELFRVRQAGQAKAERERELKALSDTSGPSGHQKLQVCDVCGAYLSRLDNDRRLADHFYGKMHLGYAQMRKTYDAFPKEMKGRQAREERVRMEEGEGDVVKKEVVEEEEVVEENDGVVTNEDVKNVGGGVVVSNYSIVSCSVLSSE